LRYTSKKFYKTGARLTHNNDGEQSDQKIENRPIFGNVAKPVAKISNLKLKVQNNCIKSLLNVKMRITNHVFRLLNCFKIAHAKVKIAQNGEITPNLVTLTARL